MVKSNLSSFEKRAQLASAKVSFRKLDDYTPKTPSSSKIGERLCRGHRGFQLQGPGDSQTQVCFERCQSLL